VITWGRYSRKFVMTVIVIAEFDCANKTKPINHDANQMSRKEHLKFVHCLFLLYKTNILKFKLLNACFRICHEIYVRWKETLWYLLYSLWDYKLNWTIRKCKISSNKTYLKRSKRENKFEGYDDKRSSGRARFRLLFEYHVSTL